MVQRVDEARSIVERLRSQRRAISGVRRFCRVCGCAQDSVDTLFRQPDEWSRKAVINCLSMGSFSSDRSIREYADRIWSIRPVI